MWSIGINHWKRPFKIPILFPFSTIIMKKVVPILKSPPINYLKIFHFEELLMPSKTDKCVLKCPIKLFCSYFFFLMHPSIISRGEGGTSGPALHRLTLLQSVGKTIVGSICVKRLEFQLWFVSNCFVILLLGMEPNHFHKSRLCS